ncbi:MAG: rhodanese-like domain-containing protein [Desulfobacteraceae bacterium]|jgi:rhodanese-related sulfurtransferase
MSGRKIFLWMTMLALLLAAGAAPAADYKTMTAEELQALLPGKDFFLLDVHIPEQAHIAGTDAFIDFRRIRENAHRLPADKDTKIVVYCLSGGMSRKAAHDLIAMGYTKVYDLLGGTWAFRRLPTR